ncbi:MAG: STAS domain-containing protein [Pseudomonadales bacterium]|nr:STAS domain-containing protein [Pseudomonadales bacterium]
MAGTAATVFAVPEAVGFQDAAATRHAGEAFVDHGPDEVDFDLSGVRASSSLVVALLLAWLRHARGRGKQVRFLDPPADLRNIIELYGVTELLPLVGEAGEKMKEYLSDGSDSDGTPAPAAEQA